MIDNILGIFDRIEENLENSLALERNAEKAREATYDDLLKRLNKEITKLNGKISDLNREISTLNMHLQQYSDNLAEATERLEYNTAELGNRQAECSEEERLYLDFNNNM